MSMNLSPGCIVEFSAKGTQPEIAAVLSVAPGSARLYLLNGKETNIPEKKVLHSTARAVTSVSDRETCKQNLVRTNSNRNEVAASIDLAELHELLVEEQRPYGLIELAGFLFAPEDEDSAAALLRRLCDDKIYFKHRNEGWQPATAEELRLAIDQQNRKEQLEREEVMLVTALKSLGRLNGIPAELNDCLEDLKNFIASGEEAKIPRRLSTALEKAGLNNQRKLFQALVSSEILHPDENFAIIRHRLPVDFSDELVKEAATLCQTDIRALDRLDLTALRTWAIDTPGSKDRDDAFSFEQHADGGATLWVHIADPAELILPDSPLDREAARRGSSVYMPDQRVHMLPPNISEHFLSLDEGSERLALTLQIDFDAAAAIKDFKIRETFIKIDRALDYDFADSLIAAEPWLEQALAFAVRLKKRRESGGAMIFPRQPELDIKVVDGEIIVTHRSRDDLTQGMIAEFMIWANHAAAEWCRRHNVPCLYRTQEGEPSNNAADSDVFDPVAFFAILRTLRKTVVSGNPGRHNSLGLDSYTQVTSPLRRYSDLLLHRQIKAAINGRVPVYDQNDLSQAMMIADTAVSRADEIMRDRERYFLLKYLKQRQASGEVLFDGVVVDAGMTEVTFYVDFICSFKYCRRPSFDVSVGQKVVVKVTQIDPFDGFIRFDLRQT